MEPGESGFENCDQVEGQLLWMPFLSQHALSLSLFVMSLAIPVLAIQAGPGKSLIADAFAILVGTASLLLLIIRLAVLVTHFRLAQNTLTFTRPGWRTRTVATSDVAAIHDESESVDGATVWLRDGTTLALQYDELTNSRELLAALHRTCPNDAIIEGCLIRSRMARILIYQWLASCLLLAIAVFGGMCLAVFLQPKNLGLDPPVFLLLGSILLLLAGAGFYGSIVRFWVDSARSFQWDGTWLRYRTLFSGERVQSVDEVEAVSTRRPNTRHGEQGSWRVIRFRNGECLKLQVGMLHNADRLYSELKAHIERRPAGISAEPMQSVTSEHPLWPGIQPHLVQGESVLWLGRPVYGKLWSEMSAEVIFGLIPSAFGLGMLMIVYHFGVRQGNFDVWPFLIGGLLFGGIGACLCAAPWRYRKMLRDTVYAVTTQRVLIVNGLLWGSQSAVHSSGRVVESLTPEQVQLFEVVRSRQDILLGGQWKRTRKGTQLWVHSGFLAADDPEGARSAIHHLLNIRPISRAGCP